MESTQFFLTLIILQLPKRTNSIKNSWGNFRKWEVAPGFVSFCPNPLRYQRTVREVMEITKNRSVRG